MVATMLIKEMLNYKLQMKTTPIPLSKKIIKELLRLERYGTSPRGLDSSPSSSLFGQSATQLLLCLRTDTQL